MGQKLWNNNDLWLAKIKELTDKSTQDMQKLVKYKGVRFTYEIVTELLESRKYLKKEGILKEILNLGLCIKLEIFLWLWSGNININTADCMGTTPLIFAVQKGRIEIVRFLLDAGADPNLQQRLLYSADRTGMSALRYAVSRSNYNMVKLLLEAGADPNIQCSYNTTFNGSIRKDKAIDLCRDPKIKKLLLSYMD